MRPTGLRRLPSTSRIQMATIGESAPRLFPRLEKSPRHSRLQEDQKAPATINREIQILGRAFRLGVERREILPGPHIRRLAENNVRQGFFTRAEFEAVVAALPEYLQDFTRFAHLCAWRKGQTASLKWEHVDRSDGIAIAPGEIVKNKHPHKIVLEGELAEIIERRVAGSAIRSRERAGYVGVRLSP